MSKRARTVADRVQSADAEDASVAADTAVATVNDRRGDLSPPPTPTPTPLTARPSLLTQLAHIRQLERPWSADEVERVRAELSPATMRGIMSECYRVMSRNAALSLCVIGLLTRICEGALVPVDADRFAEVPTALRLPTAVWTHAMSWCGAHVKYKLLHVSHAFLRMARMPAAWAGGVRLPIERGAAVKLMRMFPDAPRLATRLSTRVALDVEEATSTAHDYLSLRDVLAYFAPHPNANVRDLSLRRYDSCELLPHSHVRIAAAFPRLDRLQIVGPYWLAARNVQLLLDCVSTLTVFELRRGGGPMRWGATEALKSVWLPPTLREYRDYVGAATVCVGPRDARHDTRCHGCDDGVGCNNGDVVFDSGTAAAAAAVAVVAAVSDPHPSLSAAPPPSAATEYALKLLHLARGARVDNPLSDVPRLTHLADVYYAQSPARAHAMQVHERRSEWEHCHALVRHPSLTRLHCTPIRVHENRDENLDLSDDDSEEDEEGDADGVAKIETATTKHARWVQYVAGLPPLPSTRSRLERLSLQFHRKVSTSLDVGMFTHLRDLRVYTQDSDDSHFDPMLATLVASVASESGRLEYVLLSSRYGDSSSQKFGFKLESAVTASGGDGGGSDGEEVERKDDGGGNRETKGSGGGDSDEIDGNINAPDGIEASGGDRCGHGSDRDDDREPVTHAFLWLPDERRTVVLLPHTRAHDANLHADFSGRQTPTAVVHGHVRRRLGVDRIGAPLAALLRRRTVVAFGAEYGAPRPAHPRPRLTDAKTCATMRRDGRVAHACYCDATASLVGGCTAPKRQKSLVSVSSSRSSDRWVATSTSFAEMWPSPPASASEASSTGANSEQPSTTTTTTTTTTTGTVSQSEDGSLTTDGDVVGGGDLGVAPRFQYVRSDDLWDPVVAMAWKPRDDDDDDDATADSDGGDDDDEDTTIVAVEETVGDDAVAATGDTVNDDAVASAAESE